LTDQPEPENKAQAAAQAQTPLQLLLNPIVVIAISMQFAVFVLIGAAIFGFDRGHVLAAMSGTTFARGLITYLFTTITAGTAVVLVVSALTNLHEDKVHEARFQRGKEVLSLLLGVFGTIVGFYFGSEVGAKPALDERALEVAPFHLSKAEVESGDTLILTTVISGGRGPYQFGVGIGGGAPDVTESTDASGWINKELKIPAVTAIESLVITLIAKDVDGHEMDRTGRVTVHPKPAPKP
jgi:hypothetical protein